MKRIIILSVWLLLLGAGACAQNGTTMYTYQVEEVLPHDVSSYTQGLFFVDGQLYESAGQYGESSFRKVDLSTGRVQKRVNFDRRYFNEGACVMGNRLFILTWREELCFVYDINTLQPMARIPYKGEGWGLTTDGKSLIMSDGSSTITFRNPDTFLPERTITVTHRGNNVLYLNELEYIRGEIWANIYGSDIIARIDPATGKVNSLINCSGLLPASLRSRSTDVLNGIAYNEKNGYIYLTGKYWPKMYRITLRKKSQ